MEESAQLKFRSIVRTSRLFNKEYEIIEGLKFKAIGAGAFALILGYSLAKALGIEDRTLLMAFTLGFGLFVGWKTNQLQGGSYPSEGLEAEMVNLMGKKTVSEFDLNKSVGFRMENGKLFNSEGDEVEVYEITSPSETSTRTIYRLLLDHIKYPHQISWIRDSRRRTAEGQERLSDLRCFVVLSYSHMDRKITDVRSQVQNALSDIARRMDSMDDVMNLYKGMIQKERMVSDWEIQEGFFAAPMSLIREEALLHVGDIESRALCLTLADLPEYVGPRFQAVLNTINSLPSSVTVSFKPLMPTNALLNFIDKRIVEKRSKEPVEDRAEDKRTNHMMTISAIVHGTKEELRKFSLELKVVISSLPDAQMPKFAQDNAIMKKSLKALFPACGDALPNRRRFKIRTLDEALRYVPGVVPKGHPEPLLNFKTLMNTAYGFALVPTLPTFIWGGMGAGKTAIMNMLLRNWLRGAYRGERRHTFIMTAGDGYEWLLEGKCELSMRYAYENMDWMPLDFHPLKALFAFGVKGIEEARNWIADICSVQDEKMKDDIARMLGECKEAGVYKMSDFYRRFEAWVYEKWPEDTTDPEHHSRRLVSRLKNYANVKGSLYGRIFEPEVEKDIDFKAVKTFYVTQLKAEQAGNSEALRSFFKLAGHIFTAWDTANKNVPLNIMIDELNQLLKAKAVSPPWLETILTQGRKIAQYLTVGSQVATDITNLTENLVDRFKRFLFADGGPEDVLTRIMRANSDELKAQRIKEFESVSEEITMRRTLRKEYPWGLINQDGTIDIIALDMAKADEWFIASDKPSRDLKADIKAKFGFDDEKVAEVLARFGPAKIPKEEHEYPKPEIMDVIYGQILRNG